MKEYKRKNSIAVTHPHLAKQWHPTLNGDLKPTDVTHGSGKTVWWMCEKKHEWSATPNDRSRGSGCPYCANKKVWIGFNDLATTHHELSKEWHPTKNSDLTPYDITYGHEKKVWWLCEKGHEWQATPNDRSQGSGCPFCQAHGTSKVENILLYYIKKYSNNEVVHRFRNDGYEIDIFIPSIQVGIEYDGVYYHADKTDKDLQKNKKCLEHSITLYRVRENGLPKLDGSSRDYYYNAGNKKNLSKVISIIIFDIFGVKASIDIDKDYRDINAIFIGSQNKISIAATHPELAKEWHPTKNGNLTPNDITYGSGIKVWWKCEKGHEWEATPNDRSRGKGCPVCANKKVVIGYNDLQTRFPDIAKQWHPTKNGNIKPTDVAPCSKKHIWWIDENGKETQSTVCSKTQGARKLQKVV